MLRHFDYKCHSIQNSFPTKYYITMTTQHSTIHIKQNYQVLSRTGWEQIINTCICILVFKISINLPEIFHYLSTLIVNVPLFSSCVYDRVTRQQMRRLVSCWTSCPPGDLKPSISSVRLCSSVIMPMLGTTSKHLKVSAIGD